MVEQAGRELVERIASQFLPYAGQEFRGPQSLVLHCSAPKCYRKDEIELGWAEWPSGSYERKLYRAAEKFLSRGWGFEGGPICPDCRLGRRPESK